MKDYNSNKKWHLVIDNQKCDYQYKTLFSSNLMKCNMIRFLLFLTTLVFSIDIVGQIYQAPPRNYVMKQMQVFFIGQYRMDKDGFYHYIEINDEHEISSEEYDKYTEGLEHFYCYDKKNNKFYFYTNNTIGYYNPSYIGNVNYLKNLMKENNVKVIKDEDLNSLLLDIKLKIDDIYNKKNDAISEKKRIEREKYVKDSIETAQREAKEKEEYRKTSNWHDFRFSLKHSLECQFCHTTHYEDHLYVISLSNDTIYYLRDFPDMKMLGNVLSGIHYSQMKSNLKEDKKFCYHVKNWNDSISQYNNLTNMDANIINAVKYNDFKTKIKSVAPNGFIQRWGWELNSADGVEPSFSFFNTTDKTIKYVDLYFSLYNAVGDKCILKYERSYIGNVRGVGPVEPFEAGSWNWDRATHYTSSDASEMRIVKLIITYMDGTTKTIPNNSIIYDE